MYNKTKKFFFPIIFLCFNILFNFNAEAACSKVDSTVGNKVIPLNTKNQEGEDGSLSTYDKPAIKVKVNRCEMFSKKHYTLILHPGDAKTPSSDPAVYTYYGQISTDKKVCENKCVYEKSCSKNQRNSECKNEDTSDSPNCDPQVTSITINMCNSSSTNEDEQESVGICAYKSKDTGYEQAVYSVLDAFYSAFTDPAALFNPAIATDDFFTCLYPPDPNNPPKNCSQPTTPSGFNLLDCFPVPIAALPPPFCKKEMKQYSSARVFRICEEGETPVRTKSGSSVECVKPLNNMKSTFMHPCVRVTYDNPSASTSVQKNSSSDYQNYYTTNWEELLYTSTEIAKDKNGNDTKIRYAKLYDDVNNFSMITSPPLELFGFNDAAYVDICGDINEDGTITTLSPNSFVDQFNQTRKFILTLPCDTDPDEEDNCTTAEDRFKQVQICVSEQRDGNTILQDCVTRPEMDKPEVSFCSDSFNDKNSACMQVTAVTSSNTTANYQFQGPMNQCTDPPQPAEQPSMQLCTISSQTTNPFGFQAILTNRCYVNLILAQQGDSYAKMCYQNNDSCAVPQKQGGDTCGNCAMDEYCFTPYSVDNNNQPIPATVTGAERLCLFGYTSSYTYLSPQWCQDSEESQGCNRICALPQSDTTTALIDVTNRKIPSPNTQPPITSSCPYPIDNTSSTKYRTRNPIEEDLCVDVYTIEFNKECKPSKKGIPFPRKLCNSVKDFCSIIKEGSSNHYKNFDSCQAAFKDCLANPDSTDRKNLGGTINYTCKRLSRIIKT